MTSHRGSRAWRKQAARMLRESDICWLCGKPGADSIDHVVPVAKGGSDAISNLRPAHLWPCNQRKGSRVQVQATRNSREW